MANVDRAAISNCLAYNVTSAGYVCGIDGAFPGNTNATACNDITYTNCKFQNISTSTAIGFKAEATVGLSYYECSVQGTVKDGISFDSRGGNAGISGPGVPNTINNLQIRNFRIAYADDAMIYLKLFTGFVKIDGLYVTGPSRYVIHAEAVAGSTENPHLYVENLPYLLNTSIFKTTGGIPASNVCNTPAPDPTVVWEFKEVYDGQNIFGAARWDSGLIPYYRYAEFFNESKKILTNSISINNKFI